MAITSQQQGLGFHHPHSLASRIAWTPAKITSEIYPNLNGSPVRTIIFEDAPSTPSWTPSITVM